MSIGGIFTDPLAGAVSNLVREIGDGLKTTDVTPAAPANGGAPGQPPRSRSEVGF